MAKNTPPSKKKTAKKSAGTASKKAGITRPNGATKTAKAKPKSAAKGKPKRTAKTAAKALKKKPVQPTRGSKKPPKSQSAQPKAAKSTAALAPSSTPSMPTVGSAAPNFSMNVVGKSGDEGVTRINLADFIGKQALVLYFYPKADTPGCTKEACAFQAGLAHFQQHGAAILGVSPDEPGRLVKFRSKYGLAFPFASDPDTEVAKRYGVWVEKSLYGRHYMGVQRATFLIAKTGHIAAVWPKVKVDGHSEEVLAALKTL